MRITASDIFGSDGRKTETELIVIEEGCLNKFEDIMHKCGLGGAVAGLFDSNTVKAIGMVIPEMDQTIVLNADNLHADERAVEETLEQLKDGINVIVSFGSGTVTDIARYCAKQKNINFVCCPTASSVDGFCSSVCAMTFNKVKVTLPAVAPKLVIADLNVIKNAPIRLTKSGLGDILGKYVSLADWEISDLITDEHYSEATAKLVKEALKEVTNLAENGAFESEEFYIKITYALILSGLAMQFEGSSRPASGAEHHFSHLLTISPESMGIRTDALHGESVGVGALAMSEYYSTAVQGLQFNDDVLRQAERTLVSLHKNGNNLHDINFYRRYFGASATILYDENKNDCLAKVNAKSLQDNWDKIKEIISKIPSVKELGEIYRKLGLKSSLRDLGVDESKKDIIIGLSPFVRNRLTFNRLTLLFNTGGMLMND